GRVGTRIRAAALGLLALCACNPSAPKPTAGPSATPAAPATQPALHITGHGTATQPVRIVRQIHNRIEYELLASSFESRGPQGHTRAVFQNATVTFHDSSGGTMTARAPQAIVDEDANSLTLVNGVIAHTAQGETLLCDRLVYDRNTQMLHGTGNVTIVGQDGFKATGSSFDSDISLTHMTMH
ncbi:MAG: LPS export ABC transporter periplasmic protein LptC, partial [Candidatus Eremiobacteraeota bacterium]|nr:LPS export ABC transporter periplasmic protein LptC [Candidatus Eremiobacteraeota bacterium]